MKAITTKEIVSLAVIAIAAHVLALAIVVSAHAILARANDLLLLALTLCGAVVSGINGFGRRTVRAESSRAEAAKGHVQSGPHFMRSLVNNR